MFNSRVVSIFTHGRIIDSHKNMKTTCEIRWLRRIIGLRETYKEKIINETIRQRTYQILT